MNHNCPELLKLRQMLDQTEIPYEDGSDYFIHHICPGYMTIDRVQLYEPKSMVRLVSVIHGCGTAGGFRKPDKSDDSGLLEVVVRNREPIGFQTAEQAYEMIKEVLKI